MLSQWFATHEQRLHKALTKNDLKQFRALLAQSIEVDFEPLALTCITLERVPFLEALLEYKHLPDSFSAIAKAAIQSTHAAPILSALLKAGLSPRTTLEDQPFAVQIIKYSTDHKMVLLSLLNQHGLDLNEIPELIDIAIELGERPLLKYLIESGMIIKPAQLEPVESDIKRYVERLLADKQLRDSWQ